MYKGWNQTVLDSEVSVIDVLSALDDKNWFCRGQSRNYGGLTPSIDRSQYKTWSRIGKIVIEASTINYFKANTLYYAQGEGESKNDRIIALMVLQHYGVPTRLLDWSLSPWVAAYFAIKNHDEEDGEIWTFDKRLYGEAGAEQWKRWPQTTTDGSGERDKFNANLTAFSLKEPPPWIICAFYPQGFPRQIAQDGYYTMTARFNHDHATMIKNLLIDISKFHVYVIKAALKPLLRKMLKNEHNVYRGSLFPDSAGAAETVKEEFFNKLLTK